MNWTSPLFSELVNCVKDIQLRVGEGVGVDVVHDLVDTDEGPRPAHPGTAVDQERTSGCARSQVVGVQEDVGQLHQSHQVACTARRRPTIGDVSILFFVFEF